MAEGDAGKVVVNNIVEAMWHDVVVRIDLLGVSIKNYLFLFNFYFLLV